MGNLYSKENNKIINSKIINITTPNYIYNDLDLSYNINKNTHINNSYINDKY